MKILIILSSTAWKLKITLKNVWQIYQRNVTSKCKFKLLQPPPLPSTYTKAHNSQCSRSWRGRRRSGNNRSHNTPTWSYRSRRRRHRSGTSRRRSTLNSIKLFLQLFDFSFFAKIINMLIKIKDIWILTIQAVDWLYLENPEDVLHFPSTDCFASQRMIDERLF